MSIATTVYHNISDSLIKAHTRDCASPPLELHNFMIFMNCFSYYNYRLDLNIVILINAYCDTNSIALVYTSNVYVASM